MMRLIDGGIKGREVRYYTAFIFQCIARRFRDVWHIDVACAFIKTPDFPPPLREVPFHSMRNCKQILI